MLEASTEWSIAHGKWGKTGQDKNGTRTTFVQLSLQQLAHRHWMFATLSISAHNLPTKSLRGAYDSRPTTELTSILPAVDGTVQGPTRYRRPIRSYDPEVAVTSVK